MLRSLRSRATLVGGRMSPPRRPPRGSMGCLHHGAGPWSHQLYCTPSLFCLKLHECDSSSWCTMSCSQQGQVHGPGGPLGLLSPPQLRCEPAACALTNWWRLMPRHQLTYAPRHTALVQGEVFVWTGMFLMAGAAVWRAYPWTLASPLFTYVLLRHVSGIFQCVRL